jgi:hypothetical protein
MDNWNCILYATHLSQLSATSESGNATSFNIAIGFKYSSDTTAANDRL